MGDEPSCLGLLNAIAVGEARAHALLDAWRRVTPDSELAATLNVAAIRAQAHAAAFRKRLCELGYGVNDTQSRNFDDALEAARSPAPDADKFRRVLGYGTAPDAGDEDPLARAFEDRTIDPETGALLGRYIAEQRDSQRLLRGAWRCCREREEEPFAEEERLLRDIAERIDRLARTLEDLKQLRN